MSALCEYLSTSADSPVRKYTRAGDDVDSVFDLRAIFQQAHAELDIGAMPELLLPPKGKHGLQDFEKAFSSVVKGGDDLFDTRGVNRKQGALVVVRPDQYIAHVLPLNGFQELAAFFDGFMLER